MIYPDCIIGKIVDAGKRTEVWYVYLKYYIKTVIFLDMDEYVVTIAFDDKAQKWYAQNDDIPILLEDWSIDAEFVFIML